MNGLHGIIFSYENPTQLGDLVAHRVPGSVPFAGDYRMIDFILSDLKNAGVADVGVIMHGKCQSLLDHLGTGKSWDLSRLDGGLKLLPAFAFREGSSADGRFRGKMEALGNVMNYLRHIRQDHVVLCDSDIVVNLPLQEVLRDHIASGADITCVCTEDLGSSNDVYFSLDASDRITDVAIEMSHPAGWRGLNIFVLKTELLVQLVEDCAAHNERSFREDVLQKRCGELRLQAWRWQGYEAHIDSVLSYYRRSMELLDADTRRRLFDPARPVYAKETDSPASYIDPAGGCVNSLISEGCDIRGSVKNSIICRGVRIEKGASVENCIVFKGAVIKSGATLRCLIVDKNVQITENTTLLGHENYPIVVAKDSVI